MNAGPRLVRIARTARVGRCLRLAPVAVLLLALSGCIGFTEPSLQALIPEAPTRVEIPPLAGKSAKVDIMVADQTLHRLYVADSYQPGIDVFDISMFPGKFIRTTRTDGIPSGLTLDSDLHRVYAGMDDSTVAVLDGNPASPKAYTQIATIDTKGLGGADLIEYVSQYHRVYVTNPDDGFLSAIDTRTDKVIRRINGLGVLEQPRFDPVDGMVYVPNPDDNTLIKIDPATDTVVARYTIKVICSPNGLAINPATNQGLIGCTDRDTPAAIAWDFTAEKMTRVFDQAGAGDAVIFDAVAQHFYFAASNYSPAEIAVFNADPVEFLTAVPTSHGSHTVAYDEAHQAIYTFDARHLEAGMWAYKDPVSGCSGPAAQRALYASTGGEIPGCHVLVPATVATTPPKAP